jgi:hypothetical protein
MSRSSKLYFTQVVATPSGDAFLAGNALDQGSEPTFTRFAKAGDSGWVHLGDLGAVVYAATAMPTPDSPRPSVLALGREGPLRIFRPGQPPTDMPVTLKDKSAYFESLCVASDGIYICGGQRQIAHRVSDKWNWVDQGLFTKFDGTNDCSLFSIAELADSVLIVVGTRGFVAVREPAAGWRQLDVGTNVDLHCAIASGDGGAWICGDSGTLIRLTADRQSWVDESDLSLSTHGFDGLALLKGTLYITAFDKVLALERGKHLAAASGPKADGAEFHSISAAGDFLWVTGDERAYRLGPAGWNSFLCPDNL